MSAVPPKADVVLSFGAVAAIGWAQKRCGSCNGMIPCPAKTPVDAMRLPRRQFLQLAVGAAALPIAPHIASAQAYPSRPVRIMVGFAAGGATDIVARIMGQWLSERLGQQFVVENRPGAGTNIATEAVVPPAIFQS